MWTNENRAKYNRDKLRYPSDVTDEEWAHVAPLIPPAKRLGMFRAEVCRAWLRALRRRSQRSRKTWERFRPLIALHIPKVRTLHPYPSQRFAS